MEANNAPAPRLAATLVILRDVPGLEVLLTVRPSHMRFMGGATVFPGGAIAPEDADPRWAAHCAGGEEYTEELAAAVAALREAFEEVRFPPSSGTQFPEAAAEDPAAFLGHAIASGATLRTAELVPAGRWVTPLGAPLRFDTHFFLTRAPEGWEPSPDPSEVEGCSWVEPGRALEELGQGLRTMAPPTIEVLQKLASSSSVDDALGSLPGTERRASEDAVRLSPLVRVMLAPNPGPMTGPGTNTYIVGGGGDCIVIDPAVGEKGFLDRLVEATPRVAAIAITHRHGDHVGGARSLAEATGAPVRAFGDRPAGEAEVLPLADGDALAFDSGRLVAIHTPGHASDHLCFLMEGAASLFSGDTILGEGTAVIAPPEGNMGLFMASLERLRMMEIDRIFPGHWRPLMGGSEVIGALIAHREARAEKILAALTDAPSSLDEVVKRAYADTPGALHEVAKLSASAHLQLMEEQGLVQRSGEDWMSNV